MGTPSREHLMSKVKALLAKTLENGCTEMEASAALEKAQAMMEAYEISEADLELTKQEKAILGKMTDEGAYQIKRYLCMGVAKFTNTKTWYSPSIKEVKYCGLPPDVDFAQWLTSSLEDFTRAELVKFLAACMVPKGSRRRLISGFIIGCTTRISERLKSLAYEAQQQRPAASTQNALVVVQQAAIQSFMAEHGIRLHRCSRSVRSGDEAGVAAGRAAGDRASFGRPVGSGGSLRLTAH